MVGNSSRFAVSTSHFSYALAQRIFVLPLLVFIASTGWRMATRPESIATSVAPGG